MPAPLITETTFYLILSGRGLRAIAWRRSRSVPRLLRQIKGLRREFPRIKFRLVRRVITDTEA